MRRSRATALTRSSGLATTIGSNPITSLGPGSVTSVIGADQGGDERVANDVGVGELDRADAADALDELERVPQAAALARRQVGLRHVAGDDDLGAVAHAREEHLHLRGRGVLRLVEDDEALV